MTFVFSETATHVNIHLGLYFVDQHILAKEWMTGKKPGLIYYFINNSCSV